MAYRFECSESGCAFVIRSHSDEEVAKLVRAHVRDVHGGRIDPADLERGIERVDTA